MEKLYNDIISLLRENARYGFKEMASMLSVAESDIKSAVEYLEKEGVIAGYSAIINDGRLSSDDSVEALIEVKVTPQRSLGFDAIAQQIYKFTEVKSLYLMSGGFDLAVFIRGKSLRAVAMFVSEKLSLIENITATATHFILKKYKIEGIVADGNENGKRMLYSHEL